MRLTFKRIEIHNFMSFADDTFDFDQHNGLNLICGKNNDIPGSKNGSGKCLDKNTHITVEIPDDIFELFTKSIEKCNNGNGK